jgi:dipeptidyl aminopeptidase/acylaminoacyl peptidase
MWPIISFSASTIFAIYTAGGQPSLGAEHPFLAETPYAFTSFEQQSAFTKRFYSREEFDLAKNNPAIECLRIQYASDGLKVTGFLVKPRETTGKRYPAIVYNRGGLLEIGKIDMPNILDFYRLASNGFVVLASQYRGNDGGEGREQFGGADVDDVTNLLTLAATLPYVDQKNLFFYGFSRGGMMTLLALRQGAKVNAAVVVGAVFDLNDALQKAKQRAPRIFELVTGLIPDYANRGEATLRERSAINWPEKLSTPLLIIHGAEDEEASPSEALAYATKLNELHKCYELVIYAKDIHEAAFNREDRDARIMAWFRKFLR